MGGLATGYAPSSSGEGVLGSLVFLAENCLYSVFSHLPSARVDPAHQAGFF